MTRTFFVLLLSATAFNAALLARESEGERSNSLLLNGAWEFAIGNGNEQAETAAGQ